VGGVPPAGGLRCEGPDLLALVRGEGARTSVAFQFGTTTAYGQSTTVQTTGPDNGADAFSAALSGLPAGTTIHYRAVATSDFGTEVGGAGQDVGGARQDVGGSCSGVGHHGLDSDHLRGDTSCTVSLELTVTETLRGHRVVAVSARKTKVTDKTVVVGTAKAIVKAGHKQTVRIALNRTGRNLLLPWGVRIVIGEDLQRLTIRTFD
jgi:hypothetical protein